MRELIFHLAQAIKSDENGALSQLKEHHEGKIVEAEESIRRLCKKKYQMFLGVN